MNLSYIKSILEIEKCGSMTLAAKHLFMAQPNLSKMVKEVEHEYDIMIFGRTSKGVIVTPEGQRFIKKLKTIQDKIDNLEKDYLDHNKNRISLKIAGPRASYVSYAFTGFLQDLEQEKAVSIHFQETSAMTAINNILEYSFDIGIIRFEKQYEQSFFSLLDLKGIDFRPLLFFDYVLLYSKDSKLADQKEITQENLQGMIQIMHGDSKLPSGDYEENLADDNSFNIAGNRRIYVYERGSQFDILSDIKDSYMWVSPMPQSILEKYGLAQRTCDKLAIPACDYLIFNKDYNFSYEAEAFVNKLKCVAKEISQQ